MNKLSKQFKNTIVIIILAWIVSIGIIYIKAWIGPSLSPASGSGAVSVGAGGKVGIGDTTPGSILEVSASGGADDLLMLSSNDANDGDVMIVQNGGNVGIGTTNPAGYKLNVNGNVNATAYYGDGSNLTGISSGVAVRDTYRNLIIQNTSGFLSSKMDIDIDEIMLQDTSYNPLRASNVNLTVDIAASGANGLDTGSEASNTWYHIWVISDGTTTAGLFSTSSTAPTMPGSYSYKAYVGAVYNDASMDLNRITQVDDTVLKQASKGVVLSQTQTSFTLASLSDSVPTTARKAKGFISPRKSGTYSGSALSPSASAGAAITVFFQSNGNSGTIGGDIPWTMIMTTPQTIYYRSLYSPGTTDVYITGWEY